MNPGPACAIPTYIAEESSDSKSTVKKEQLQFLVLDSLDTGRDQKDQGRIGERYEKAGVDASRVTFADTAGKLAGISDQPTSEGCEPCVTIGLYRPGGYMSIAVRPLAAESWVWAKDTLESHLADPWNCSLHSTSNIDKRQSAENSSPQMSHEEWSHRRNDRRFESIWRSLERSLGRKKHLQSGSNV